MKTKIPAIDFDADEFKGTPIETIEYVKTMIMNESQGGLIKTLPMLNKLDSFQMSILEEFMKYSTVDSITQK